MGTFFRKRSSPCPSRNLYRNKKTGLECVPSLFFAGGRELICEKAVSKSIPYPQKMQSIFCLWFGLTPLPTVRRARRYTVVHSRNSSIPRLLRVTSSRGYVPYEMSPTDRVSQR